MSDDDMRDEYDFAGGSRGKHAARDLARRVAACKAFRWLPGMQALAPGAHAGWRDGFRRLRVADDNDVAALPPDALPDIADPLTALGLLVLVREAWGDPCLHVHMDDGEWRAFGCAPDGRYCDVTAATELECLVAALEVADAR